MSSLYQLINCKVPSLAYRADYWSVPLLIVSMNNDWAQIPNFIQK